MSTDNSKPKKLSLSGKSKLALGGGADTPALRGGGGRAKTVQVEVRRKRVGGPAVRPQQVMPVIKKPKMTDHVPSEATENHLTAAERANRMKVLRKELAHTASELDELASDSPSSEEAASESPPAEEVIDPREARRRAELAELEDIERQAAAIKDSESERLRAENAKRQAESQASQPGDINQSTPLPIREDNTSARRRKTVDIDMPKRNPGARRDNERRRAGGKMTISQALSDGDGRMRSLASMRRQREKARMRDDQPQTKQIRDVTIPDTITVQDLANRMAERAGDVVKELMKQGVMATVNQTIDAETASLVTMEFGHKVIRVSEADIEEGLIGGDDAEADLHPRPPVVTIMGHVDHGKTSLLDAIRTTNITAGESGGITQHIGAYQITAKTGAQITFIDTPGHEAFSEMRSRGAGTTDIVVLVVAADDSVKAQTVEAINHARAASCPIIVAVNKCDKPGADPARVRSDLLQHEIITEDFGGDALSVNVSAHTGEGLEGLEEAILLQAELLDLKANPHRAAQGVVIEAKVERGRGSVASVLVGRGTLRIGDIFVIGAEFGRVRALLNDRGEQMGEALPGQPVEILGLNGTPQAGDNFVVVEHEARAREISEYRKRRLRDKEAAISARGSVEQMLSAIASGESEELPIVIKTDVHGSLEAIRVALDKLATEQVKVRILTGGVGAISESDVSLASASQAMVIGFNVRAIPQARDLAKRDGINIRYHSIIYELIDEVRGALAGLLSPERQEDFIGYAEIKEVFSISKTGKAAGCIVTEGVIKKGCQVRLLRDNVVIYEGALKSLRRFKDEVKEIRAGTECGLALENYNDIQTGDMIECFEITEIARTLD